MAIVTETVCDYIAAVEDARASIQGSLTSSTAVRDTAVATFHYKLTDVVRVVDRVTVGSGYTLLRDAIGTSTKVTPFDQETVTVTDRIAVSDRIYSEELLAVTDRVASSQQLTVDVQSQVTLQVTNTSGVSESLRVIQEVVTVTDTVMSSQLQQVISDALAVSKTAITERVGTETTLQVANASYVTQRIIAQPSPRLTSRSYVVDRLVPSTTREETLTSGAAVAESVAASAVSNAGVVSTTFSYQALFVVSGQGYLAAPTVDRETGSYDLAHGLHTLDAVSWADGPSTDGYIIGEGQALKAEFHLANISHDSDRKIALEALWLTGEGIPATIANDGKYDRTPRVRQGRGRYQFGLGSFANEWDLTAVGFEKIDSAEVRLRNSKLRY